MATKRIGVTLDINDYKKLKRIARFQKRSMDKEGGVAIQAHLQKLNPETK